MKASRRQPTVYLDDIAAAIGKIEFYTVRGRKAFLENTMIQDAVLLQFAVIGDAAAKLPLRIKHRQPGIAWKNIVGMRNIIVHDYSEVSMDMVWDTIKNDLPSLRTAVVALQQEAGGKRAA